MRKEVVFRIKNNSNTKDKYYFQKDKKPIKINDVNTEKIVLSYKTPYGEKDANEHYIAYVGSTGFRPLHTIIKKIKLYTNQIECFS